MDEEREDTTKNGRGVGRKCKEEDSLGTQVQSEMSGTLDNQRRWGGGEGRKESAHLIKGGVNRQRKEENDRDDESIEMGDFISKV